MYLLSYAACVYNVLLNADLAISVLLNVLMG